MCVLGLLLSVFLSMRASLRKSSIIKLLDSIHLHPSCSEKYIMCSLPRTRKHTSSPKQYLMTSSLLVDHFLLLPLSTIKLSLVTKWFNHPSDYSESTGCRPHINIFFPFFGRTSIVTRSKFSASNGTRTPTSKVTLHWGKTVNQGHFICSHIYYRNLWSSTNRLWPSRCQTGRVQRSKWPLGLYSIPSPALTRHSASGAVNTHARLD